MDRILSKAELRKISVFKEFEWLDLIPYSIGLTVLSASIYILKMFIGIAHMMHLYL